MRRDFVEGPALCMMCGETTRRRARFWAAFPDRDERGRGGFPLNTRPPVPSWRMTECENCGAVSPVSYPSAETIESFYATADEPNDYEVTFYVRLDLNPKAIAGTEALAEKLTRLLGHPGRVLEVGCASGWILKAARDRGWTVKGIEAAPKFSRFAQRELGLDIFEGPVGQLPEGAWEPFDVVMGFDVFEHLHDPVKDLTVLRTVAKPGAYLLLTTPDIASRLARLYGVHWGQVVPSHINYSTPRAMQLALKRSGWQLERLSEPRYWDPEAGRERRERIAEYGKLAARAALLSTVVPVAKRLPQLQEAVPKLTGGRLHWKDVTYRVGHQPILGDVMFVVARAV